MPISESISNYQIESEIESFVENFRKHGFPVNMYSMETVETDPESGTTTRVIKVRPRSSLSQSSEDSFCSIEHAEDVMVTTAFDQIVSSRRNRTPCPCKATPRDSGNYCCESSVQDSASSCDDYVSDNDENMEDGSLSKYSITEVEGLLRSNYIFISGGKVDEGYPIITFPENSNFGNLSEDSYRKLILYLVSIPSLQDADLGFVLIIDRRNDKWSSVKTALIRISSFFPGLLQLVYIIRPAGFFQKAISEVSNKLFKDEFKFKVVVCNYINELYEHVNISELTTDIGGTIPYSNDEWIEHRLAVEKFSENAHSISKALRELTQKLQDTELPNDVPSTEELLEHQGGEYTGVKGELHLAMKHGETLLHCIKNEPAPAPSQALPNPASLDTTSSHQSQLHPDKLINVTAVERLLIQLDETEKGLDNFWDEHEKRLSQCLELRKFEQEFKELQMNIEADLKDINEKTELGDNSSRVEILLKDANVFKKQSLDDICKAEFIHRLGEELILNCPYALDSIQPKCVELKSMCDNLRLKIDKRIDTLEKYKDLHSRIDKANKWCSRGVDLLASQQIEKYSSPEFIDSAFEEIKEFLYASSVINLDDPREFKNIFGETISSDTKALVQQVLKRIEDVQTMCLKRRDSLKSISDKRNNRPIQPVNPEFSTATVINPSVVMPSHQQDVHKKANKKGRTLPKMQNENESSQSNIQELEHLLIKRNHVMAELLETEQTYVFELASIIQGYKKPIDKLECKETIPHVLHNKTDVLFGNLEHLYKFHNEIFLKDLQSYANKPEFVGIAFTLRKDTFHQLYSHYCQNKPKSEALRRQCGDSNPFFKDCQRSLGHRLPLGAYLLKPIQRITKYQLLLKDLIKYSPSCCNTESLTTALENMLVVLKDVNDSLHQVAITGFHGDLSDFGKLLMHGSFNVWIEHKKDKIKDIRFKPMQRHVFFYEQLVLFTKKNIKDVEKASYHFKNALKMSQIGLTECVKGDKKKFELWLHNRSEVYTVQAPSLDVKDIWVKEIKRVLLEQLLQLKGENKKQYSSQIHSLPESDVATIQTRIVVHSGSADGCSIQPPNPANKNDKIHTVGKDSQQRSQDKLIRRATEPSIPLYPQDGWSSDNFSDEEDDAFESFNGITKVLNTRYIALEDYNAVDVGEVTMCEGDIVEVTRVGCNGYWYVKLIGSFEEGWVPASYLERVITKHHPYSRSSASVSSQDSVGMKPATSRSSVASTSSQDGFGTFV